MKKFATLFIVSIFMCTSVFAQKTNDKGSTGGNNKHQKPQNNKKKNNNKSDGLLIEFTKIVFGAYQNTLISKRGNDKSVFGIEAGASAGYLAGSNNNFFNVDPRLKLNRGALSIDARYDFLKSDTTQQQNIDALVELNLIIDDFKMALGQGIMYNIENSSVYHESLVGIELGLNNRQILVSPELRLAYDWAIKKPVNLEVNLKGAFRLVNYSGTAVYIFAGGGYRYMLNDYANFFGGLNIIF